MTMTCDDDDGDNDNDDYYDYDYYSCCSISTTRTTACCWATAIANDAATTQTAVTFVMCRAKR